MGLLVWDKGCWFGIGLLFLSKSAATGPKLSRRMHLPGFQHIRLYTGCQIIHGETRGETRGETTGETTGQKTGEDAKDKAICRVKTDTL